jgi:hypothetical protein
MRWGFTRIPSLRGLSRADFSKKPGMKPAGGDIHPRAIVDANFPAWIVDFAVLPKQKNFISGPGFRRISLEFLCARLLSSTDD